MHTIARYEDKRAIFYSCLTPLIFYTDKDQKIVCYDASENKKIDVIEKTDKFYQVWYNSDDEILYVYDKKTLTYYRRKQDLFVKVYSKDLKNLIGINNTYNLAKVYGDYVYFNAAGGSLVIWHISEDKLLTKSTAITPTHQLHRSPKFVDNKGNLIDFTDPPIKDF